MSVKLCKDCKHCNAELKNFAVCELKTEWRTEIVTGQRELIGTSFCRDERRSGWLEARCNGECGKEGRYWEAK